MNRAYLNTHIFFPPFSLTPDHPRVSCLTTSQNCWSSNEGTRLPVVLCRSWAKSRDKPTTSGNVFSQFTLTVFVKGLDLLLGIGPGGLNHTPGT